MIGGHPRKHSGTGNKPYTRVVVHSAVVPCEPGRARQLGEWNRDGVGGGSWHYSVDCDETFQCSYDRYICWHAPPNGNSIGIEMADWPVPVPKTETLRQKAAKTWRWARPRHQRMLRRTARLTARLLAAQGLPPRFISEKALRANPDAEGWTTHNVVSRALGQSSHWDPGFWPRLQFALLVRGHHARIVRQEK